MSGAARRAASLRNGAGLNKMLIEDELSGMYPKTRSPLIQHATGVDVDAPNASIIPMGTLRTTEDLEYSPWEGKDVSSGSELGLIAPHQYLMDTVYKPVGLEKEARARLRKNPFLSREKQGSLSDLLVHNEDYAIREGRGGSARPAFMGGEPGAMEVAAFASDGPRITRHEARHLITKPYVYEQMPANIDVSNAIARALLERRESPLNRDQWFAMTPDQRKSHTEGQYKGIEESRLLASQNLDSVHELIAHLGDAHDQFVRKNGRFVETDADAERALEFWANTSPYSVRVEPQVKRDVIMDAFRNGGQDAMSRILRYMYAVPVAAGVAGSQQQNSPLRGLNQ